MKSLIAVIAAFQEDRKSRANLKTLLRLLGLMAVLVLVYSVLFHVLMVHEGQKHSWLTGVYWTFTVMTTLGFGDITFQDSSIIGYPVTVECFPDDEGVKLYIYSDDGKKLAP